MCEKCRIEATGLRSGKGPSILSKIFGLYACNHSSDCCCSNCQQYRQKNEYADFGFHGNRPCLKEKK